MTHQLQMEHQMNNHTTDTEFEDQWQMPPAQTEELPAGLIEDQI
jgi:hypothetical protein